MGGDLSYDAAGATRPAEPVWPATPTAYRRFERTARIGHGPAHWEYAATEVLRWGVKTRSGFTVTPADTEVRVGENCTLSAHLGPFTVDEPVRVVDVVRREERCGFSYGTREGHPVCGEEAFVVHLAPDGSVWLTLRSLTRPAEGRWRPVFPVLLVAQRYYRRRYLHALAQV